MPALRHLEQALAAKAEEFAEVVKSGRTHLMDATPVTLGQEFGGYAAQVRYGIERVEATLPRVAELPLGGTAVGTGINTPPGFAAAVIAIIVRETGLPLTEARDHFEAQGARDGLVEASGALRTIAVSLTKIANDLRWMGSGPRAGLGEIALPDLQPGSSIMPGKVNPVICEATTMVCAQVIGNDAAVAFAGASGNFELNVMLPVMARNLLESIRLLANVSRLLADRCVSGIVANVEHCRALAESSPSIVTPLNRYIGLRERGRGGQEGAGGEPDDPRGGAALRLRHRRQHHRGPAGRRPRRAGDDPPDVLPSDALDKSPMRSAAVPVAGTDGGPYAIPAVGALEAPGGAGAAVAVLHVPDGPDDLGGRVGPPVAADAGHLDPGSACGIPYAPELGLVASMSHMLSRMMMLLKQSKSESP